MENNQVSQEVKRLNVYQRLAEVRKKADYIQKQDLRSEELKKEGKKGQGYKAVSSALVLMKVNEAINENGLILITDLVKKTVTVDDFINSFGKPSKNYVTEIETKMTWVNIDDPKDIVSINWGCNALNSSLSQSVGSCLTYNEKYFIMKFFNIATDELDPDIIENNKIADKENESTKVLNLEDEKKKKQKLEMTRDFKHVKDNGTVHDWTECLSKYMDIFPNEVDKPWFTSFTNKYKPNTKPEKVELSEDDLANIDNVKLTVKA